MKRIWDRFTLADFATEEDDGKIPKFEAAIGTGAVAAVLWAAWTIAQIIVQHH